MGFMMRLLPDAAPLARDEIAVLDLVERGA
jgi:hypothetical protein